jgi:DNA-binding transcriptional ArsR family regulator
MTTNTGTEPAVRGAAQDADQRLAAVLAAVGEPNRLLLLRLLLDGERCVAQCVEQTGLGQSLVSKHLARLVDVGLVQRRTLGRRNYHSVIDPDGLRQALSAVAGLVQPDAPSRSGPGLQRPARRLARDA